MIGACSVKREVCVVELVVDGDVPDVCPVAPEPDLIVVSHGVRVEICDGLVSGEGVCDAHDRFAREDIEPAQVIGEHRASDRAEV